jgi:dTDP-4-dehydrorhamnose reductase
LGRAVIPDDKGISGVYHVACGGSTSWCGFAREILEYAGARMALGNVELVPISSDEYAACAARPAWSVLSTERARATFGFRAVRWQEAARLCLDEIAERR